MFVLAMGTGMLARTLVTLIKVRFMTGRHFVTAFYTAHEKFMNGFTCAGSTLTVRLFQQVAAKKPLYVNQPNRFCFKGHIPYCYCQQMITIGFTGTMYVCSLNNPIELHQSTIYFAIFFKFPSRFSPTQCRHQIVCKIQSLWCRQVT